MTRYNCPGFNRGLNRSSLNLQQCNANMASNGVYNRAVSKQNKGRGELSKFARSALQQVKRVKRYLPGNIYNNYYGRIRNIINGLPTYVVSVGSGNQEIITRSYRNCYRICWRFFGRRRCSRGFACGPTRHKKATQSYYVISLNNNFDNEINSKKNELTNIIKALPGWIYNNCGNPYTMLNESGMEKCKVSEKLKKQKEGIALTLKETSNETFAKIKNTKDFPQWNLVNQKNNFANAVYSWDPMSTRSDYNNSYSKFRKIDMENTINLYNREVPPKYNNCQVSSTSLSTGENTQPECLKDEFYTSIEKCNTAYQMAQKFQYGADKILDMWTDVSNSIPGNTLNTTKTVLNNSNDSCKKWVEMFNVWQKLEDEAIAKPCVPERPIRSTTDSELEEIANSYSDAAGEHINSLKNKLQFLKDLIKKYPNVLELNKENISTAPPSMVPTVSMKKETVPLGELGIQYLEMILPSGEPGESGITGIDGIPGFKGRAGPTGTIGETGPYLIPNYFNPYIDK